MNFNDLNAPNFLCLSRALQGDERSFLFSVRPKLLLYLATGANENFQYFNFGTETLPNGLVRYSLVSRVPSEH